MTSRVMSSVISLLTLDLLIMHLIDSPDPKIESIRTPNDIIKSIGEIECFEDFTKNIGKLRDEEIGAPAEIYRIL